MFEPIKSQVQEVHERYLEEGELSEEDAAMLIGTLKATIDSLEQSWRFLIEKGFSVSDLPDDFLPPNENG